MKKQMLFALVLCLTFAFFSSLGSAAPPGPIPTSQPEFKGGVVHDPTERDDFTPVAEPGSGVQSTIHADLIGIRVLFDQTHEERNYLDPGDPTASDDNWALTEWRNILVANGATVDKLQTGPITDSSLAGYDVLVISMPTLAFSSTEISAVENMVSSGRGVLLLGEGGADSTYWFSDMIINQIVDGYGISLNPDNVGASVVTNQIANRPGLTDGVATLELSYCASVSGGDAVFYSSDQGVTLMATAESGGRVAVIGDTNLWADNVNGMNTYDNGILALNTIAWLSQFSRTTVTTLVVDEQGVPVSGANVYLNGVQVPGSTDSDGTIQVQLVRVGDELAARYRILEQATNKGAHSQDSSQNWAYRVYVTSADVGNDGTVNTHVVASTGITQTLTLKKSNTLIGFNIVASVEWDASDFYLNGLEAGFQQAAEYLYDASDGQQYFERVTVYDDKVNWNNADYQFRASNQEWPHTNNIGGILDGSDKRVYFGRQFNGQSANQGPWTYSSGYRTLVHEFGHYGLYLYDEYFYYGGFLGLEKEGTQCTANRTNSGSSYSSPSVASSLMDYQFSTTEFCSTLSANPHNHNTYHHQKYGESTWDTIVRIYSDSQSSPRWQFQTPVSRGQVVAGPNSLPVSGWIYTEVDDANTGTCAGNLEYYFENIWGNPAKGADIWVKKSSGRTIYEGKTDNHGYIRVLGAANGDTLTAKTQFDLFINSTIVSCPSLQFSAPAARAAATVIVLGPAPFTVDVSIVPGDSANSLGVRLHASTPLIGAPEVFLTQSGTSSSMPVAMYYDGAVDMYVGTATLDPTLGSGGIVEVHASSAIGQSIQTFANFQIETAAVHQDVTIFSGDGDAELYLPAGSLSDDAAISVFPSAVPDPPVNQDLIVVSGPYELVIADAVSLQEPAGLTLRYHDDVNQACNVDLETLKVYRWNLTTSEWVEVGGTLDAQHHMVSTPIESLSIYALIGERQFRVFVPVVLTND